MKMCKDCNQTKPLTEFYPSTSNKDLVQGRCKPCQSIVSKAYRDANLDIVRARSNAWRDKNPDKAKAGQLKAKFGITLETYNSMLAAQNNCCPICNRNQYELKINMAVDHCHTSLKIRGLLCDPCNKALGYLRDNPEFAENAAIYLRKASNAL